MHRLLFTLILVQGKTLQTIALFCHLKERDEACGPSLVVCPLSVLNSWCCELKKWAPSLRVLLFHTADGNDRGIKRKELTEAADKYDVVVTTYDMVRTKELLAIWARIYFRYVVLDEGHKIKNRDALTSQAVRMVNSENRLLLTGTPLQNNLVELVSLLNFLHSDIFTNVREFEKAFNIGNGNNSSFDKEMLIQAQKVLGLFMLRRKKDQVEKLLPKKIETKVSSIGRYFSCLERLP